MRKMFVAACLTLVLSGIFAAESIPVTAEKPYKKTTCMTRSDVIGEYNYLFSAQLPQLVLLSIAANRSIPWDEIRRQYDLGVAGSLEMRGSLYEIVDKAEQCPSGMTIRKSEWTLPRFCLIRSTLEATAKDAAEEMSSNLVKNGMSPFSEADKRRIANDIVIADSFFDDVVESEDQCPAGSTLYK